MTARVAHIYSELDEKHYYYCDNTNFWTWFGLGQTVSKEMNLYPYIPSWKPMRTRTISAKDYSTLGERCGKQLMKYFKRYGI